MGKPTAFVGHFHALLGNMLHAIFWPDEMALPAGFGLWAVVWRPLIYTI